MRGPFPRRPLPKPPTTTSLRRRRCLHIHHVHLPTQWPTYTPYLLASSLQTTLSAPHHAHKASPSTTPAPDPILLSFTPTPTYTLGRRQRSLPASQLTTLSAPLSVRDPFPPSSPAERQQTLLFAPEVHHSPRGGLTTYHGPGQLVLWPIIDLRSPHHPHLSVRAYASLLEDTTASVLRERFGISTFRDEENPGVWVRADAESTDRKIAALGIHLRRHITTLGLALNITVPTKGDATVNPWARFTPCGIPDRDVTSVAAEIGADLGPAAPEDVRRELDPELIATAWCAEFKRRLEAGG